MVKTLEERQARYDEQIEQRLTRYMEAAANHNNAQKHSVDELYKALSPAKPIPSNGFRPKGKQTVLQKYMFTRTIKPVPQWHIPIDILLEIASHLSHPLDLLHCSWISRGVREALMSRRCRSLWKMVLRRVPDLPPSPDDLSEPLYTALVFGQHCFACGCSDAYVVDYALRLRLCDKCYGVNVVDVTKLLKKVPDAIRDVTLMLSPAEELGDGFGYSSLNPLYIIPQDRFFKPEIEAITQCLKQATWNDVPTVTMVLRARVEQVLRRKIHAVLVNAWQHIAWEWSEDGKRLRLRQYLGETLSLMECKRYLVPPLPWDPQDEEEGDEHERYKYRELPKGTIVTLAPEWMSDVIKPFEQLQAEHRALENRMGIASCIRIEARYLEVEYWYGRLLGSHNIGDFDRDMLPDTYDGARLWAHLAIGDDARRPIKSIAPFGSTEEVLRNLQKYKEQVQQFLLAKVPDRIIPTDLQRAATLPWFESRGKGKRQHQESLGDLLGRANILFVCTCCKETALSWSKIHLHWRIRHPYIHVFDGPAAWHKVLHATFWEDGYQTAQKILETFLLGPRTPAARLDSAVKSGQMYCACGDPSLGPSHELTWATLVKHVHSHLEMNRIFDRCRSQILDDTVLAWIDDHHVAECVKYLPPNTDTSASSYRVSADTATRSRVEKHLDRIPNRLSPICRVCRALIASVPVPVRSTKGVLPWILSRNADAIVYHLRAKHGRNFSEEDVLWEASR